ncbi:MAG: hypothetical protein E7E70_18520, partial [Escherichia coli]|nr:hypothetical protein [Escherichia coli]
EVLQMMKVNQERVDGIPAGERGFRSHEMSFARDVADRAIFMDQGRIVEQGVAKALFADPQQPRTRQFMEKFLLQ